MEACCDFIPEKAPTQREDLLVLSQRGVSCSNVKLESRICWLDSIARQVMEPKELIAITHFRIGEMSFNVAKSRVDVERKPLQGRSDQFSS